MFSFILIFTIINKKNRGTLRKGDRNHFYLTDATCICKQCWVVGALFDTDNGYPVLLKVENTSLVYGELYDVTTDQLKKIDHLEGYVENDPENLYEREYISVVNDKGEEIEALTYFGGKGLIKSDDKIEIGDWNVYSYLKRNNLL